LAERLGFAYAGDQWLLDIPFAPSDFYRGLAASFYVPNRMYAKAVEAYERAFSAGEGQAEDYYDAAIASAYAGDEDQAFAHLHTAIRLGGIEEGALQTEEAFLSLHRTEAWSDLIAFWADQRRGN